MFISEFILTKTREPNAKIVNSSLVLSIVKIEELEISKCK